MNVAFTALSKRLSDGVAGVQLPTVGVAGEDITGRDNVNTSRPISPS